MDGCASCSARFTNDWAGAAGGWGRSAWEAMWLLDAATAGGGADGTVPQAQRNKQEEGHAAASVKKGLLVKMLVVSP